MSRRLTEERFSIACANASTKIKGLSTGRRSLMSKTKRVIQTMITEERIVDAKKETKELIQNQYLCDIYDELTMIITRLSLQSKRLPEEMTVPADLLEDISTVLYFEGRIETIKELTDMRKLLIGQFGPTCTANAEAYANKKLKQKYVKMNTVEDRVVDILLKSLDPKNKPAQSNTEKTEQSTQQGDYSRFASMNNDSKFPDMNGPSNRFPSMDGDSNKFPSMGQPQQQSMFPSMNQQPQQQNMFPSMGQQQQPQQNMFPSMGQQQQPQQNMFPSMNQQPQQQNMFPSMGQQQKQSMFPSMNQQPPQQNMFPSMNQQQQGMFPSMGQQQTQSNGTFAVIPDGPMPSAGKPSDDELFARMAALHDN